VFLIDTLKRGFMCSDTGRRPSPTKRDYLVTLDAYNVIQSDRGIDVNAALGPESPHRGQQEVAFPGGIAVGVLEYGGCLCCPLRRIREEGRNGSSN
jgi:hypothetical protein